MNHKKILVVDDSPIILKTLSMKLESGGYHVLTADEGSRAIGLVRRERPDLIVLDINFPPDVGAGGGIPWDGFLILDWLRRMDEAKGIPVILMSRDDPAQYKDRATAAGAYAVFHKPIDNDQLLAVIGQVLGNGHGEPQAVQ
jgi:CheY-like chemotaxis protein